MRVQDLNIHEHGLLQIGTAEHPLPHTVTAEIIFVAREELMPESPHFSHKLGLFAQGGRVEMHGRRLSRITRVETDLAKGQIQLAGTDGRKLSRHPIGPWLAAR